MFFWPPYPHCNYLVGVSFSLFLSQKTTIVVLWTDENQMGRVGRRYWDLGYLPEFCCAWWVWVNIIKIKSLNYSLILTEIFLLVLILCQESRSRDPSKFHGARVSSPPNFSAPQTSQQIAHHKYAGALLVCNDMSRKGYSKQCRKDSPTHRRKTI